MEHFFDVLLAMLRDIHGEFSVRYLGIGPQTPFAQAIAAHFLAAHVYSEKDIDVKEIEHVLGEAYEELENCSGHEIDISDVPTPPFDKMAEEIKEWMRNQLIGQGSLNFEDANRTHREVIYGTTWINPEGVKLSFLMEQAAVKAALAFAINTSHNLETLTIGANKVLATMNIKLVDLKVY